MVMTNKASHSKKNHHRYCLFDARKIMKRKAAKVTDQLKAYLHWRKQIQIPVLIANYRNGTRVRVLQCN